MIQSALDTLRKQHATESAKIGPAHAKAAKARQDAAKTRSQATRKSKLAEADREDKKASDAETHRAKLEARIAVKLKELTDAQRKRAAADLREQQHADARLRAAIAAREEQTRPVMAGRPRSIAEVQPNSSSITRRRTIADVPTDELTPTYDVFVSHASEDKEDIARPLVVALEKRGLHVWFDELSIRWGQSIHRSIEEGIAHSRFGLIIISPHFMAKQWTNAELDALYDRSITDETAGILPLWHGVTLEQVQANLPMIAALKAFKTADWTIDQIADEVVKALQD